MLRIFFFITALCAGPAMLLAQTAESPAQKPPEPGPAGATPASGAEPEASPAPAGTEAPQSAEAADDESSAQPDSVAPLDAETQALLERAEAHFFAGRNNIALRLFRMIMNQAPEHPAAYRYAGDIELAHNRPAEAERYYQIARELSPRPGDEWFRIGQSRYLQKDGPGALAAFREARRVDPELHQALFYEGVVQFRIFRNKDAVIAAWRKFRELVPDDPQGPAIDAALAILQRSDYQIPVTDRPIELPDGTDTRRPYLPAQPPEQREDDASQGAELLDEL